MGCLDFASLYPSNIIGNNLCPTTVARKFQLEALGYVCERDFKPFPELSMGSKNELIEMAITDQTLCVLRPHILKGQCPEVAKAGLELRGRYKKLKKKAENDGDKHLAAYYSSLELAVKATNNSLYGIIVQVHCPIFNPDMANAITQISRDLNVRMTQFAVTHDFARRMTDFDVYGGMKSRIVYGDTDSIFVTLDFPPETLQKHGPDMRRYAPAVFKKMEEVLNTEVFRAPHVLMSFRDDPDDPQDKDGPLRVEYEKLCSPYYQSDRKKTYFYIDCDLDTGEPVKKKDGTFAIKVTGGQSLFIFIVLDIKKLLFILVLLDKEP